MNKVNGRPSQIQVTENTKASTQLKDQNEVLSEIKQRFQKGQLSSLDSLRVIINELCDEKQISHAQIYSILNKENRLSVNITLNDKSSFDLKLQIEEKGAIGLCATKSESSLTLFQQQLEKKITQKHLDSATEKLTNAESPLTEMAKNSNYFTQAEAFYFCIDKLDKSANEQELLNNYAEFFDPRSEVHHHLVKSALVFANLLFYGYLKLFKNSVHPDISTSQELKQQFNDFIQRLFGAKIKNQYENVMDKAISSILDLLLGKGVTKLLITIKSDGKPALVTALADEIAKINLIIEGNKLRFKAPFMATIDATAKDNQNLKSTLYSAEQFEKLAPFKRLSTAWLICNHPYLVAVFLESKNNQFTIKITNSSVLNLSQQEFKTDQILAINNKLYTVYREEIETTSRLRICEVKTNNYPLKLAHNNSYYFQLASSKLEKPQNINIIDNGEKICLSCDADGKYISLDPEGLLIQQHPILPLQTLTTKTSRYIFDNDKLYCITQNKQLIDSLFPNWHLEQGVTGDCYILASLFYLTTNPKTAALLLNSFEKTKENNIQFNLTIKPSEFSNLAALLSAYKLRYLSVGAYIDIKLNPEAKLIHFEFKLDEFEKKSGWQLFPSETTRNSDLGFRLLEIIFGIIISATREKDLQLNPNARQRGVLDTNYRRKSLRNTPGGHFSDVEKYLNFHPGLILPDYKSISSTDEKIAKTTEEQLKEIDKFCCKKIKLGINLYSLNLKNKSTIITEQAAILSTAYDLSSDLTEELVSLIINCAERSLNTLITDALEISLPKLQQVLLENNSSITNTIAFMRIKIKERLATDHSYYVPLKQSLQAPDDDTRPKLFGLHAYMGVALKDSKGNISKLKLYNPHNTALKTYEFNLDNDLDVLSLVSLGFSVEGLNTSAPSVNLVIE